MIKTREELIKKYLEFFKSKNHAIIISASLIPENDPSILFTTAGMHPLVPYLMGQKHPLGKRLVDVQKCIRTTDIDEVGDAFHHTFFEMLGNWSLGDYFKKEAIEYSFEFLTKHLNMPIEQLGISVFAGDADAPRDEESAKTWIKLGITKERIAYLPKEKNWWGPAGESGPCGPDTEMFYYVGLKKMSKNSNPGTEEENWCEIWNDVLIQYNKTKNGTYEELKQKNIDTGMGVERTLAVINGLKDNYETTTFQPIMKKIEELSGKKYKSDQKTTRSMRIVADHLRAATFILGDEKHISPSNLDQGYIIRRLIRKSIRHGKLLGIDGDFTAEIARVVIALYKDDYAELKHNEDFILTAMSDEEAKFKETLERGLKEFEKLAASSEKTINAKDAFMLYQSFGFPLEMTVEIAKEHGLNVDEAGFNKEYELHQDISRTGSEKKFKGGLGEISNMTIRLHTATHILNQALRDVVDKNIKQKGSNITLERLRFDFNYDKKLTDKQIKDVEDEVNRVIGLGLAVERKEMPLAEAKKLMAQALFTDKYSERVSVYSIGTYSKEVCAGPHVNNTAEIKKFKIVKEEAVAAGVRRIKAVVQD